MGTDDTTEWKPPEEVPLRGVKPLRRQVGIAYRALARLTSEERAYVMCWFCNVCRDYIAPGKTCANANREDHRDA